MNFNLVAIFVFLHICRAEPVYEWRQDEIAVPPLSNPKSIWRSTGIQVNGSNVFISFVDLNKETDGNGFVGYFSLKDGSSSPQLKPYPAPNYYRLMQTGNSIKSPTSIKLDKCGRLWILDSGVANITGIQRKSNPSFFIFNTTTNQLLSQYMFPNNTLKADSFFVNFVVQDDNCQKPFAFVADFNAFRIVVFDFFEKNSWLVEHHYFHPDPMSVIRHNFLYNQQQRDLSGVFGLTIVRDKLYFHPLASPKEFSVPLESLKQKERDFFKFEIVGDKGYGNETGLTAYVPLYDVIFDGRVSPARIFCWKPNASVFRYYDTGIDLRPYSISDLVTYDSTLWILTFSESVVSVYKKDVNEIISESFTEEEPFTASASYINTISVFILTLCIVHLNIIM